MVEGVGHSTWGDTNSITTSSCTKTVHSDSIFFDDDLAIRNLASSTDGFQGMVSVAEPGLQLEVP